MHYDWDAKKEKGEKKGAEVPLFLSRSLPQ
jgi:hypothetical protein